MNGGSDKSKMVFYFYVDIIIDIISYIIDYVKISVLKMATLNKQKNIK